MSYVFSTLAFEALLIPNIPSLVVVVGFPVSVFVFSKEFDSSKPLGALPTVKMRYERPRRKTLLDWDRFAVHPECDQRILHQSVLQRHRGRVTICAVKHRPLCLGLNTRQFRQFPKRYAFPNNVFNAPRGNAMEVSRKFHLNHLLKVFKA